MTTTQSYDDVLAARYGTGRSRWRTQLAVGTAVAVFAAGLLWAAGGLTRPRIEANVLTWQASDTGAMVALEVRGTSDVAVRCVLRAQDTSAVDIGYREFRVERSPATVSLDLPTLFRPATVTVLGCAPEGETLRVPPPDFPPGVAIP
jgi:hypothetical protein